MADSVSAVDCAAMKGTAKPVLAVDVDETIAKLMPTLVRFHNEEYGGRDGCPLYEVDDFHTMAFNEVWGGTPAETDAKLDKYYTTHHFLECIEPIEGAKEHLLKLREHFDLHVVTARGVDIQPQTVAWIERHYDGIFAKYHFGNHYCKTGVRKSKSTLCREIGAVALVDDSAHYAADCARNDVPVILFGDYAWNRGDRHHKHELVHRAKDWTCVHRIVTTHFLPSAGGTSSM